MLYHQIKKQLIVIKTIGIRKGHKEKNFQFFLTGLDSWKWLLIILFDITIFTQPLK